MILIPILILILVFGEIFIIPLVLKTDIERTLFLTICHTCFIILRKFLPAKVRKNVRTQECCLQLILNYLSWLSFVQKLINNSWSNYPILSKKLVTCMHTSLYQLKNTLTKDIVMQLYKDFLYKDFYIKIFI
jgi:hypothetical protein